MQDGTGLHDTGRSGRPPRISDAEIRAEIERRLSGPPEDLVAYRVQRALEARHGSIPQMARVQRLLCEMRLERQVPAPAARQPEADLDGTSGQVRAALATAAGQVCRLLAEAVLAAEDAQRERGRRDLAARDAEMAELRAAHAGGILQRDREIEGLVRLADERLAADQKLREQSEAERTRLDTLVAGLEVRLREREVAFADLRLRVDRAEADRAALQQVADRVQGDRNDLAIRLGELGSRLEAASLERDQVRAALAVEQERSAAREQARVATEARLEESRTRVDRLEVLLERVRREAAEAGGRVAVLEAALAAERRRGAAGREPRPLRTAKDTASQ
jgi:hypothetical protein